MYLTLGWGGGVPSNVRLLFAVTLVFFFKKRLKVNLIIFLVKRMPHGEVHAMTIFHGSNVQNILVDQRVVNLFSCKS
jgi:hypothetical protein